MKVGIIIPITFVAGLWGQTLFCADDEPLAPGAPGAPGGVPA